MNVMKRAYFDHNATTPPAPEALEALLSVYQSGDGNASSIHSEGQTARRQLEAARRKIANYIGANATEIVFTSGGTESNNLAILGLIRAQRLANPNRRIHVMTTAIEHPSVLEAVRQLSRMANIDTTYIDPDPSGVVNAAAIQKALRPETVLISCMHANNETGAIQPIPEIAAVVQQARCNGQDIHLHVDGVQALSKIPFHVVELGADLYSMSAHKVHALKGTGALYIRKGVAIQPLQFGGRHERERRAGTENVAGAVAFARALELPSASNSSGRLRDHFEQHIIENLDGVRINGADRQRLPNTSNLYFENLFGEAMVIGLDLKGFAVSSGSACASGSIEPSHVLLAMGLSAEEARRCVRFSFGRYNTIEETNALSAAVIDTARQLRAAAGRKRAAKQGIHAAV